MLNPNKELVSVPPKPVALVSSKIKTLITDEPSKGVIGQENILIQSHSCNISKLPSSVQDFIDEKASICQPESIYVCDGSEEENKCLLSLLEKEGWIQRLEGNK